RGEPFMLPRLSLDCALGSGIVKALRRRDWPFRVFDAFERPVADLAETYEDYARAFIGRNRRKSIRRLRNRLAGTGVLRHEVATHGPALAAAADTFLALEAGGWKGRAGTALACRSETEHMLRAMIEDDVVDATAPSGGSRGASRGAGMRADLLLLDERPIAASLGFVSDGVAHMWKIADDETMRSFGPGIVLEDAILRQAHLDDGIRRLDSAAGPGSALETLYGGRTRIGDLVFVPTARGGFQALLATEDVRRRLRGLLKSLRNALWPRPRRGAPARASRR
ncbi:MAG TPA: GNAT family N-acetyltransferase, partial [Saliniramus sp.]|nr:GNAT family N-acetyltransferase [Saliniramus sp.]